MKGAGLCLLGEVIFTVGFHSPKLVQTMMGRVCGSLKIFSHPVSRE